MRKFNIRKVLDGLTAGSSSSSQQQQQQQHPPGNREPEIQETLQSEHFQLCKVKGTRIPATPSSGSRGLSGGTEGWTGGDATEEREQSVTVALTEGWLFPWRTLMWGCFGQRVSLLFLEPLFPFSHTAVGSRLLQTHYLMFNSSSDTASKHRNAFRAKHLNLIHALPSFLWK